MCLPENIKLVKKDTAPGERLTLSVRCVRAIAASLLVVLVLGAAPIALSVEGSCNGLPTVSVPIYEVVLVESEELNGGTATAAALAGMGVQVKETYENFVLVSVTSLQKRMLGTIGLDVVELADRTVTGRGAFIFDTGQGDPWLPSELKVDLAKNPGYNCFIVQFIGPVKQSWVDELRAWGAEIHDYLPSYSYVVTMDPGVAQQVKNLRFVQWVGYYHPAYKISPSIYYSTAEQVEVVITTTPGQGAEEVLDALDSHVKGRFISWMRGTETRFQATVASAGVASVAQLQEVAYIESPTKGTWYNDVATWVVQSNNVDLGRTVFEHGVMGTGQVVTIADSGLATNHDMFFDTGKVAAYYVPGGYEPGDPIPTLGDEIGHGTHVAGTIVGDANLYDVYDEAPYHDGHAFLGSIIVQDVGTSDGGFSAPDYYSGLFQPSYDAGSRIHSNSWGEWDANYPAGYYAPNTAEIDRFVWEHKDFVVLFAAGNEGQFGGSSIYSLNALAKNIITVGASDANPNDLAAFSSRGPADDHRLKPTVIAPGVGIDSADFQDPYGYVSWSGTSMATPAVAGCAALVRQYFLDGFYPEGVAIPGNSVSPSAALVRAMLINGAVEISGYDAYGQSSPAGTSLVEVSSARDSGDMSGYSLRSYKRADSMPARAMSPAIDIDYDVLYRFEVDFFVENAITHEMLLMEDGRAKIDLNWYTPPGGLAQFSMLFYGPEEELVAYYAPVTMGAWHAIKVGFDVTNGVYIVMYDADNNGLFEETIASNIPFVGVPWKHVCLGSDQFCVDNHPGGPPPWFGDVYFDCVLYRPWSGPGVHWAEFFQGNEDGTWHFYDGVNPEQRYPNNHQGWGRVNLENAMFFKGDTRELWMKQESPGLANAGESKQYSLQVYSSSEPLEVALVWTDYPGTVGAAKALVNNLDLLVTDPSGNQYKGNVYSGTNPGQSTTGGSYDSLNPEECVLRVSPAVGTWTVKVTAASIPQGYQPFAVVVTGDVAPPNQPPVAAFTFTTNGLTANFDASTSTDSDGTIVSYAWNFGDGTTGSGKITSHTYAVGNTYNVVLTVTDDDGATDTETKPVTVAPPNQPPVAAFSFTTSGLTANFDASASSDTDGTIVSYGWSFGDMTTGSGKTTSHTYAAGGTYTVVLTVTDDDGATDTESKPVTVNDSPPTAPGAPTWVPSDERDGVITLSWTPASDPDTTPVDRYWLQLSMNGGAWQTLSDQIRTTSFTTPYEVPATYNFRVCAIDTAGNVGPWSGTSANCVVPWDARMTSDTASSNEPAIAVDSSGNYHIAWVDARNGNNEIYYKKVDSNWNVLVSDTRISSNRKDSIMPAIAVSSTGKVVIAWADNRNGNYGIFTKTLSGGSWGSETQVVYTKGINLKEPDVVITSSDAVQLVYRSVQITGQKTKTVTEKIYFRWSTSTLVELFSYTDTYKSGATHDHLECPRVAIGATGTYHVVFSQGPQYPVEGGSSVVYYTRYTGTAWDVLQVLGDTVDSPRRCAIDADTYGHVYVVWDNWYNGFDVFFRKSDSSGASGSWSVTKTFGGSTSSHQSFPDVAVGPSIAGSPGKVYVMWRDSRNTQYDIYCAVSADAGNTFGADTRLTSAAGDSFNPRVVVSNTGKIGFTWADYRDGNWEIYFAAKSL
jgi:PKD repeat protein/subtilisin family serine protease